MKKILTILLLLPLLLHGQGVKLSQIPIGMIDPSVTVAGTKYSAGIYTDVRIPIGQFTTVLNDSLHLIGGYGLIVYNGDSIVFDTTTVFAAIRAASNGFTGSDSFSQSPRVPTAAAHDSSSRTASTAFVTSAVATSDTVILPGNLLSSSISGNIKTIGIGYIPGMSVIANPNASSFPASPVFMYSNAVNQTIVYRSPNGICQIRNLIDVDTFINSSAGVFNFTISWPKITYLQGNTVCTVNLLSTSVNVLPNHAYKIWDLNSTCMVLNSAGGVVQVMAPGSNATFYDTLAGNGWFVSYSNVAAMGTVLSVTANALSSFFTSSTATPTTTPVISYTLTTAPANSIWGNFTGSTAMPAYYAPTGTPSSTTFLRGDGSWSTPVGGVTSVSNSDGTCIITPIVGAVVASLNTAHPNNWTGLQQVLLDGVSALSPLTHPLADLEGTVNNTAQINIRNQSTGTSASSDYVATSNTGTDTSLYADFGINNNGNTSATWGSANDAYLFNHGGALWLGTDMGAKGINFVIGGGGNAASVAITGAGNLNVNSGLTIADATNVTLGTTTGTKWGTSTTAKQGWWNATPIVQPTGDIMTALQNEGLVSSPTLASADIPALTGGQVGLTGLSATGTPSSSTYLRGDNTWATVTAGVSSVTAISPIAVSTTTGAVTVSVIPIPARSFLANTTGSSATPSGNMPYYVQPAAANQTPVTDPSANLTAQNVYIGYTSIASAGSTTILTNSTNPMVSVTGTLTQTINIPSTTTLSQTGYQIRITNYSTGAVLVRTSTSVNVVTMAQNSSYVFTNNSIVSQTWDAQGSGALTTHGQLINIQYLTISGTYTPTAGTYAAVLKIFGGGGGGGYAIGGTGAIGIGGGGGSGGYGQSYITSISGTYTYTIGAAGSGGIASGPTAATAGGNSTFVNGATTITANGGQPGVSDGGSSTVHSTAGGNGGAVTNADLNNAGTGGSPGISISVTAGFSGAGAPSFWQGGSPAQISNSAGPNGAAFGAGGAGAFAQGTGISNNGGAGKIGLIVVYEYN